jgi:hypothetical protein
MSQENVDRALELLDAFNRRDLELVWWRNCPTEAEALEAAGLRE